MFRVYNCKIGPAAWSYVVERQGCAHCLSAASWTVQSETKRCAFKRRGSPWSRTSHSLSFVGIQTTSVACYPLVDMFDATFHCRLCYRHIVSSNESTAGYHQHSTCIVIHPLMDNGHITIKRKYIPEKAPLSTNCHNAIKMQCILFHIAVNKV